MFYLQLREHRDQLFMPLNTWRMTPSLPAASAPQLQQGDLFAPISREGRPFQAAAMRPDRAPCGSRRGPKVEVDPETGAVEIAG